MAPGAGQALDRTPIDAEAELINAEMTTMKFGTLVRFNLKPEWGVGVVQRDVKDGQLEVIFESKGTVLLPWPKNAPNVVVVSPSEVAPDSALLDQTRWADLTVTPTIIAAPKTRAARADAAPPCAQCRGPLNESVSSRDGIWKSCPKCSTNNGQFHVFLPYPAAFGQTDARVSAPRPDGPQSWCSLCRGRGTTIYDERLCTKVEK